MKTERTIVHFEPVLSRKLSLVMVCVVCMLYVVVLRGNLLAHVRCIMDD